MTYVGLEMQQTYMVSVEQFVVFYVNYSGIVAHRMVLEKSYKGTLEQVLRLAKSEFMELVDDYACELGDSGASYDYRWLYYALEDEILCLLMGMSTRGLIEAHTVPETIQMMYELPRDVAPLLLECAIC